MWASRDYSGFFSSPLVADIALLIVAVAWGASYPVAKTALFYTTALTLIAIRFAVTALLMGAFSWRELCRLKPSAYGVPLFLGVILFCIFICETYGVALTSATNTALIISLCVIFTPFLDYALGRALPPVGVMLGCVVAVAGVWVLTGGIQELHLGDVIVLLAAVLRAVMVVTTKRMLQAGTLSNRALTFMQALSVTVLTIIAINILPGQHFMLPNSGEFWGCAAFLSLICTIMAFFVQNYAVGKTTPTRVNLLMGTEPLWGFLCAVVFLGEPASCKSIVGAIMVVGGSGLAICVLSRCKRGTAEEIPQGNP